MNVRHRILAFKKYTYEQNIYHKCCAKRHYVQIGTLFHFLLPEKKIQQARLIFRRINIYCAVAVEVCVRANAIYF